MKIWNSDSYDKLWFLKNHYKIPYLRESRINWLKDLKDKIILKGMRSVGTEFKKINISFKVKII